MIQKKWLVAVSGGPDSMALLHIMKKQGYELVVGHVNYHQRDESDYEEKMVKDFCVQQGLSFYRADYVAAEKGNFQAHARDFRYTFFRKLIEHHQLEGVMVGHHYDDHIETYLMQKERGHQPRVLGLTDITTVKGIQVYRPLLKYTKEELIAICHEHNIPFSIDASNNDPKYTRNRIRLEPKDLKRVEEDIRQDQNLLVKHQKKLNEALSHMEDKKISLSEYQKYEQKIRIDFLREKLFGFGVNTHKMSEKYFIELDRQILGGKLILEFEPINLYVEQNTLVFFKPYPFSYTLDKIDFLKTKEFEIREDGLRKQKVSLSAQDFPITIRNTRPGDTIEMSFGRKKVSRYLIDKKIPRYLRDSWVVIENAMKECIFVVGMGCDVHHYTNNLDVYVIELNLL